MVNFNLRFVKVAAGTCLIFLKVFTIYERNMQFHLVFLPLEGFLRHGHIRYGQLLEAFGEVPSYNHGLL